jgi:hypothetical protein
VGEVLQQEPHGRVGVLAAGQVRGAQVGEVDVLERPAGRAGVEAAGGGGEEVGEAADGALDRPGLVAADQGLGFAAAVGVVLVQPDQQLGVHPSHQLLGGADGAALAGCVEGQAEQEGGDVLVVGLGPAEHGHEPVVEGGGLPRQPSMGSSGHRATRAWGLPHR